MFEGMEVERPRGSISRNLNELRQEAAENCYCLRCYVNAGLRVKVTGKHCKNCGAALVPVKKIGG